MKNTHELLAEIEELKAKLKQQEKFRQELVSSREKLKAANQQLELINHQLVLNEKELKEKEYLLNEVGKIARIGGWEMDMRQGGKANWTKGTYDIVDLDYDKDPPGFTEHISWYLPEYRDSVRRAMENLADHYEALYFEAPFKTAKGIIKWGRAIGEAVVENGQLCFLRGTFQDITKQKEYENTLREREEFNRAIVDNSKDCIKVLDLDTNLLFMSKGGQCLLEIKDVKPYINNSWIDFWKGEDYINAQIAVESAIKGKNGYFEGFCSTEAGKPKWWGVLISPILNNDGKVVKLLSISRDITEKKEKEEELIQLTQRFNLAVDSAGIGVWDLDLVNDSLTWDDRMFELYGLEKGDFGAAYDAWKKGVHPDDIGRADEEVQEAIEGKRDFDTEFRIIRPDGEIRYLKANAKVIRDEDGNPISMIGVNYDISQNKKNMQELELREKHLSSLLENPSGYTIYRTRANRETGQIEVVQVSPSFSDLLGIPESDKNDFMKWFANVHPDDIDRLMAASNEGMRPPFKLSVEVRHIHPVHGLKWFDIRATGIPYEDDPNMIEYANGIILDITERKLAEEKVLINERRLKEAEKIGKLGHVDWIVAEQRSYWSDEIFTIYERDPELGVPNYEEIMALHEPEDAKRLEEAVILALTTAKDYNLDLVAKTPSGRKKNLHIIGKPAVNEKGEVTNIRGTVQDITERKDAEEKIKLALKKAEESDRLKSAFLANMSHEIRTPMNGILGFTELLSDPVYSGEQKQKYIEIIQNNGERLINTINDIIDISRIESGEMTVNNTEINIYAVVNDVFTLLRPAAEKKKLEMELLFAPEEKNLFVSADKDKLYSILTNLVNNAIKYTRKGKISMGYHEQRGRVEFFVKDTGIGIAMDKQELVFNRFVQADLGHTRPYEGSGLGLSITKAYVEMLGGEISVESEEGQGSVFRVRLPMYKDKQNKVGESIPLASNKTECQLLNMNILIVDDEEFVRIYLNDVLESECKQLFHAANGRDAINCYRQNPEIDVILMDLKMPVMDGFMATREIRKIDPNVSIIAQTAYAMAGDREKALEAGCNDYVIKPIERDELLKIILHNSKYAHP